MKKKLVLGFLCGMLGSIVCGVELPVPVTSEVRKGVWLESFAAATNLAAQTHSPMIMVWANYGCDHCAELESQLIGSTFKTWQAAHQDYVYCFVQGSGATKIDVGVNKNSGAKTFAQTANGTIKPLSSFPFICLYWPKRNGTEFVKAWPSSSANTIMKNAEAAFADYYPVTTSFVCDGKNAWNRYEAEPGHTTFVDVAIQQDGADDGEYVFCYQYPGESTSWEEEFKWSKGETSRTFRVPIPSALPGASAGRQILLAIKDMGGSVISTSSVTFCNPENGSNNPLWKDERTVETLNWGEWTADMDTVTQKVAQAEGEAWTLVELAGSLWCPDCYRTDVNFLEDGGKVAAWARERHVALVSVDTPHNSAADPDPANPVGTIWSRDTDATKLIIAPFENADPDKVERSGKGYLSRKMISDEDALEVARRNLWLSKDFFHRPEDYASHRTLIPIFILLDKAGNVVGRFETFDARSQSPTDRAHTAEYLARFDEMIAIARESGDATGEVTDNHWSTTKKVLAAGKTVSNWLSHADFQDVYRLDDVGAGLVRLSLSGVRAAHMSVEVLSVRDGAATVVATGYGNASTGVRVEAEIDGTSAYYARVFCNKGGDGEPTDAEFASVATVSTIADYSLSAAFELRPGAIAFDTAAATFHERSGEGTLTATRQGGGSGEASVTVKLVSAAANASGRYAWSDSVLTWADGEQGAKTIRIPLVENGKYDGSADIAFQLIPAAGCPAAVSSARAVVTIVDSDNPALERSAYDVADYTGFAGETVFKVFNVRDPSKVKLSLAKSSDKLPSGLKLKYDKTTGVVVLSGTTKKTGEYEVSFSLAETRTDGKVIGETTTINLVVRDPADINPYVGKKRVKRSFALLAERDGSAFVAGTLDLSVTAQNRISAKYSGTESKTLLFSGAWETLDSASGAAVAVLEKSGARLNLTQDRSGKIKAVLTVPAAYSAFADNGGMTFTADCPFPAASDFSAYKGYYTVALPAADGSAGCGYMTLTMTSASSVRDGKMKFAAFTPEGKKLSGYAYLVPNGQTAGLSVFKRSSTCVLGVALELKPNGVANWDNPSDILSREVVNAADGVVAYWLTDDLPQPCGVAGSWYPAGATMEDIISAFYVNPRTGFSLLSNGEVVGMLVANGKKFDFTPAARGTTFAINAKTGVFSGKTPSGKFSGVLVPGWYENCDCGEGIPEFPLGAGTLWWTEGTGRSRVSRSTEISIVESDFL